jgi:hypothetical protein
LRKRQYLSPFTYKNFKPIFENFWILLSATICTRS